jgi:hypothetical protein
MRWMDFNTPAGFGAFDGGENHRKALDVVT